MCTPARLTGLVIALLFLPVLVTPASAESATYRLMRDVGQRVRWDPCTPVPYVVDPAGAPRGSLRDLRTAFAKTSRATGLRFVYAGRWRPGADDARRITIMFRTESHRHLRGRPVGATVVSGLRWSGTTEIRHALIVLQRGYTARLRGGFGAGITRGHLFLHEIGHAVGLDDIGSRGQIMFGRMHSMARSTWRAGDLAGLREVGSGQGCIRRTLD
jgi:hypothetical protein